MKSDTLGIIGGGQLGMFMCMAAKKIGAKTIVFSTERNFSAKSFCDTYIQGSFDDKIKLNEFINSADVFTIETENISKTLLRKVEKRKKLYPSSKIVEIAQNRLREKKFLNNINEIQTTNFLEINSFRELKNAVSKFEYNCILKTQEMGYDGKGQFIISKTNIQEFKNLNLSNFILEEKVDFKSEISVIVIRNKDETVAYPPVENIHKNSILRETIYPAKIDDEIKNKAIKIARKIANSLELNGILAVEMFLTKDNKTIGIGSGQPSRLDSCDIAINKMKKFHKIKKNDEIIAASDAFFPFVDGLETLVQAGVSAVIQPSGSIRDKEIIKFADKVGIILVFSKTRHFKH